MTKFSSALGLWTRSGMKLTFNMSSITLVRPRKLHLSLIQCGIKEDFEHSKQRLSELKEDPGNQIKLEIYALFKQATVGKCNAKKPGMMDFVGKAKWEVWHALGDISQEAAQQKYIDLVNGLVAKEGATVKSGKTEPSGSMQSEDVKLTTRDKMRIVTLNRPTKKNALRVEMYSLVADALATAAKDDSTLTVFTGAGDYFCSGNDLSNFDGVTPSNMKAKADEGAQLLENFVSSFIMYPKPLVAVVNGPAVGIAVTILGLFDAVYATSRATFTTPFTVLGQSPEGCSSYTFPKIMGHARACEVMLFNKSLTAVEAQERGLVTQVFPDNTFQQEVWTKLDAMAQLPKQSLCLSKCLLRECDHDMLLAVNKREVRLLAERWQSDECLTAIMKFFQDKSKL